MPQAQPVDQFLLQQAEVAEVSALEGLAERCWWRIGQILLLIRWRKIAELAVAVEAEAAAAAAAVVTGPAFDH